MLVIDTEGDAALEAVISGEMGEEATLRFLKAKLKVMQEEIVDLSTQLKNEPEQSIGCGGTAEKARRSSNQVTKVGRVRAGCGC